MVEPVRGLFLGGTIPLDQKKGPEAALNFNQITSDLADEWTPQDEAANGPVPQHLRLSNVGMHILPKWSKVDQLIVLQKVVAKNADAKAAMFLRQRGFMLDTRALSTRWQLLRKALEQAEDERLDDECNDWWAAEDAELIASEQAAQQHLMRELEILEVKKWKHVANNLAKERGIKRFSYTACRARFYAIMSGNYELPLDKDPHQQGRATTRRRRVLEAKARRHHHIASILGMRSQKMVNREMRLKALEEKDAARREVLKEQRIRRESETRRRDAARAAIESQRRAKRQAIERVRLEFTFRRNVEEVENAVYEAMTGEPLSQLSLPTDLGISLPVDSEPSHGNDKTGEEYQPEQDTTSQAVPERLEKTCDKISPTPVDCNRPRVTAATLANPRSIMTLAELNWLCVQRSLPRCESTETHPQLVARLAAADLELSNKALTDLLRKHFDKGNGTKPAKALRLANYDAELSAAGQRAVTASDPEFKSQYEGYANGFAHLISKSD